MEHFYLACKGQGGGESCLFNCQGFKPSTFGNSAAAEMGARNELATLCQCGHRKCDHEEVVMYKNSVTGLFESLAASNSSSSSNNNNNNNRNTMAMTTSSNGNNKNASNSKKRRRLDEIEEEDFEEDEDDERSFRPSREHRGRKKGTGARNSISAPFIPPSSRMSLPDLSAAIATPYFASPHEDDRLSAQNNSTSTSSSSSSAANAAPRSVTPVTDLVGTERNSFALTPLIRSAPAFRFSPPGAALAPGETAADRREQAAVNLRLNFGSLFANQRTFNRIILLDAGAVSIPQRDSKQKRVSAYRELMNRNMICETPLTLLATDFSIADAELVRNKLVGRLALLGRVLEYGKANGDEPVFHFVEKLNRTNKIDESKVKYSNVHFPPDLTIFTNACNHVNSTDLSVYFRLMVPLEVILAVPATAVTLSSASKEVAISPAVPAEAVAPALAEPANADAAAPAAVPVIDTTETDWTFPEDVMQLGDWVPLPTPAYFEQLLPEDPLLIDLTQAEPAAAAVVDAAAEDALNNRQELDTTGSGREVFTINRYANESFDNCRQDQLDPIQVIVQASGGAHQVNAFVQLTQHIRRSTVQNLHKKHTFAISTMGVQGAAVDMGGVTRHVFHSATEAALSRKAQGYSTMRLFEQRADGLWVPSSVPQCVADSAFWFSFGSYLYFCFLCGEWVRGLHCSIIKYVLGERLNLSDLRGHSDCFDRALSVSSVSEPLHRGGADSETIATLLTRDLGVNLFGRSDLSHLVDTPVQHLHRLQELVVETVLQTNVLAALLQVKAGFLNRAHVTLLSGTPTRDPLTFAYFQGKEKVACTVDDLEISVDESVDKADRPYVLLLAAVKKLAASDPDVITKIMAWVCGNSALPPNPLISIHPVNPSLNQNFLPVAHTCTSTIDLCMGRYNAEEEEASVNELAADLLLVLSHTDSSMQVV